MTKRYTVPLEERELESMRLEWSYLMSTCSVGISKVPRRKGAG
jgi:hypothetical protein